MLSDGESIRVRGSQQIHGVSHVTVWGCAAGVGGSWRGMGGTNREPRIAPALRKGWNFPGVSFGSREGREIRR